MTNNKLFQSWLIIFMVLLAVFIVLQVPAAWLLKKFAPDLRMLQNVSGSVWQGQADWKMDKVQGVIHWSTRPWELLRLRVASDVTLHSGQTQLQGVLAYGVGQNIYLQHVDGKISPETLAAMFAWQWPDTSINIRDLNLNYKKNIGFQMAEGQLAWAGGNLSYPMGQRQERIDIPPLFADLAIEKEKLKLVVKDSQKQRMAELGLGVDGMLDTQLTQRFLLHAPAYQGKAGLDTAVVSTRQPLSSLR